MHAFYVAQFAVGLQNLAVTYGCNHNLRRLTIGNGCRH